MCVYRVYTYRYSACNHTALSSMNHHPLPTPTRSSPKNLGSRPSDPRKAAEIIAGYAFRRRSPVIFFSSVHSSLSLCDIQTVPFVVIFRGYYYYFFYHSLILYTDTRIMRRCIHIHSLGH